MGKARGIRNPKLNKYVQQKVVMVRRGEQTHTEKVALHDPLVVLEVEEWAAAVQELYPKQREEGIQGWLDSTHGKLVTAVRKAMDEIEPQREAKRGGNTRPLWTPILTEVEREKALITGMLRGARAFLKKGECAEWYQANLRSAEWDIEWRIAQGKLPDTLARRRKRVAMPAVSREREAVWKRIQSTASTAPLVRLKEV